MFEVWSRSTDETIGGFPFVEETLIETFDSRYAAVEYLVRMVGGDTDYDQSQYFIKDRSNGA